MRLYAHSHDDGDCSTVTQYDGIVPGSNVCESPILAAGSSRRKCTKLQTLKPWLKMYVWLSLFKARSSSCSVAPALLDRPMVVGLGSRASRNTP